MKLFDEPETAPVLAWMKLFDTWAQTKSHAVILDALHKRGLKAYTVQDAPAILSQRGYVLVDSGDQLHIPFVLNHKVVWGGNGMVAISPSQTIIPATHTL